MNIRGIMLKYLGWCPGVESAARFISNNDVPPSRIALFAAIIVFTSLSGYFATQRALTIIGWPGAPNVQVSYKDPLLAVSDGQLYIALRVQTELRGDLSLVPGRVDSSVYTAKVSLDGSLEDETKVLGFVGSNVGSLDFLATRDGRWFMTYQHYKFGFGSEDWSDLYVIQSTDGKEWSEPVVVAEVKRGEGGFSQKMLEMKNGEVFLLLGDQYRIYDPEMGWSPPKDVPMQADELRPFIDKEGRVAIVGVDRDPSTREALEEQGLPLTVYTEEGDWTQPKYLTHLGVPLRGKNPYMFYSGVKGCYYLLMEDPAHHMISDAWWFSSTTDLESWSRPVPILEDEAADGITYGIIDVSLTERSDGTVVLAYRGVTSDVTEYPESYRRISEGLYLLTSGDGVTWTPPSEIEKIEDRDALNVNSTMQRVPASVLSSLALTLSVLFVFTRILPMSNE